jgi:hypothetical protein
MKRPYEVLALDDSNTPVRIATIIENSPAKAKATGQKLAKSLRQRFHTVQLIKE